MTPIRRNLLESPALAGPALARRNSAGRDGMGSAPFQVDCAMGRREIRIVGADYAAPARRNGTVSLSP